MATSSSLIGVTVHLSNGTKYVTSVNASCSDEQVRGYFVGRAFEGRDEGPILTCMSVDIDRS
jgi:hypothetical protein